MHSTKSNIMKNVMNLLKFRKYTIFLLISVQLIISINTIALENPGLNLSSDLWTGTKILGGDATDWGGCVAIDSVGNMIITGRVGSDNYPVSDAIQDVHLGENDVVVTKLNNQGEIVFSTYLGGTGDDWGLEIAVDNENNIIVVGQTSSADFVLLNAFNDTYSGSGYDIFVTKLNTDGELLFSTYLGPNGEFPSVGVATDSQNNIIEDDVLIALNKPSGFAVHGGTGVDSGVIEALRSIRPDARFLELVHRLDKETSGCLLIAKNLSK